MNSNMFLKCNRIVNILSKEINAENLFQSRQKLAWLFLVARGNFCAFEMSKKNCPLKNFINSNFTQFHEQSMDQSQLDQHQIWHVDVWKVCSCNCGISITFWRKLGGHNVKKRNRYLIYAFFWPAPEPQLCSITNDTDKKFENCHNCINPRVF